MREENAIFGGEHSGHFYFRDNWYADSGLIAFLIVLELVSAERQHRLGVDRARLTRASAAARSTAEVADQQGREQAIEDHYRRSGAQIDHLDGVTINFPTWWANVRPSNTEPLLRLNVEADTKEEMEARRDELLQLIRQ